MPLPSPGSRKVPVGVQADQLEDMDRVIASLAKEFLVDAADTLGKLGIEISRVVETKADSSELLAVIRRETHTMKGLGGSYGYPGISVIAHRLEDYLVSVDVPTSRQMQEILPFLDRMQEIAESGENPSDETLSRIVRALPAKGSAMAEYSPVSNREVLLVASSRILARAIEGELNRRGYRVVTVKSSLDVFETAVRTRPDMIIASAMMDGVSGIDLARALKSMRVTQNIPFVLLTSFERGHAELRGLPDEAALIHHDRDIDKELTNAVNRFGWTSAS